MNLRLIGVLKPPLTVQRAAVAVHQRGISGPGTLARGLWPKNFLATTGSLLHSSQRPRQQGPTFLRQIDRHDARVVRIASALARISSFIHSSMEASDRASSMILIPRFKKQK